MGSPPRPRPVEPPQDPPPPLLPLPTLQLAKPSDPKISSSSLPICFVCQDHSLFQDPSHPYHHPLTADRQAAQALLASFHQFDSDLFDSSTVEQAERRVVYEREEGGEEEVCVGDGLEDEIDRRMVRPLPKVTHGRPVTTHSPTSVGSRPGAAGPIPETTFLEVGPGEQADQPSSEGGGGSSWTAEMEGKAGEDVESTCTDGFHLSGSSLSKKRKVPSPFAVDSFTGRGSPTSEALPSHSPGGQPSSTRPTMSNYLFPTFPALPMGYTRQTPPLPLAIRTRLVLARVSPACRANIWAKAIWAQRSAILARKLLRPTKENCRPELSEVERRAVEFSGVGWGRGPFAEEVDEDYPAFRKEDSRRRARSGMRGVQQKLSKDGLSLYAVVREEVDWLGLGGKRTAAGRPVERWLEEFRFDFTSDSPAATTVSRINRLLNSLTHRLQACTFNDKAHASSSSAGMPSGAKAPPCSTASQLPLKTPPLSADYSRTGTSAGSQKREKVVCQSRAQARSGTGGGGGHGGESGAEMARAVQPVPPSGSLTKQTKSTNVVVSKTERTMSNASDQSVSQGGGSSPDVPPPQLPRTGGGKKKTSKKKRNALANASNPHHMKNYVPTRMLADQPSPPLSGHALMASLFFPPPTRFLSALPSKLKTSPSANANAADDPQPGSNEYLCVLCEYRLFYGSDEVRKRMVSKRKRMIARKQRAQERATGVANGTKPFGTKGSRRVGRTGRDEDGYEGEDWECDDEVMEDGSCRRCAERRARELEHRLKKSKKKKKELEKAYAAQSSALSHLEKRLADTVA